MKTTLVGFLLLSGVPVLLSSTARAPLVGRPLAGALDISGKSTPLEIGSRLSHLKPKSVALWLQLNSEPREWAKTLSKSDKPSTDGVVFFRVHWRQISGGD